MKYFIITILSFLSIHIFAQNDQVNPEKTTYKIFRNQTINLMGSQAERSLYPEMKDGKMIVFQYTKRHAENPMISDDEVNEIVMFEVDPYWNSFTFKKKLPLSKATYQLGCFCVESGYFNITGGYIRGKKLPNGNYRIEADASITFSNGQTKEIKFKGEFSAADAG